MIKIKIFRPDGTSEERDFAKEPSLATLQEIVGGYIGLIPMSMKLHATPAIMYVNEEGLRKGLSFNENATRLTGGIHRIVGNAVVVQLKGKDRG